MPSISSISSSASSAATYGADDAARIPQKNLGQNDFLKLLATQFQVQDPLKPMEDTAFIAQMAQFSALEQSSVLAKDMNLLRADQLRVTANSYLGHRVTVDTGDGTTTGDVSAVDMTGKEPRLVVGEKSYPLSAVLRVEPSLVSAPAPQPAPTGGALTLQPG
jgi:flagellar basal-body rod modification protein FlgD